MKFAKVVFLCSGLCLIFAQNAIAARLGGGRSYGMQRSFNKQNYSQSNTYQRQAQPGMANNAAGYQAGGMHPAAAGALGVAAGAAGGYMLGRSMSNNANGAGGESNQMQAQQNTQTATQPTGLGGQINEPGIPWGIIAVLGGLLFLGLMLFKRSKTNPGFGGFGNNTRSGSNSFFSSNSKGQNTLQSMSMQQNNQQSTWQQTANAANSASTEKLAPQVFNVQSNLMDKMPDGVEIMYFLRQTKGMFLHVQSMNNQDNITEIDKYMTPELYLAMKEMIANNKFVADFKDLDCSLVSCEVTADNQLIASVKFFGSVSEEPPQPPVPFNEIWNFIKADWANAHAKWVIAGIQQENPS